MAPPIKNHTLDTLRERCAEEGDCLIWRGFYNNQGIPMVYAAHPAGGPGRSGKNVSVRWRRRAAARVTTGVWGQLIAR